MYFKKCRKIFIQKSDELVKELPRLDLILCKQNFRTQRDVFMDFMKNPKILFCLTFTKIPHNKKYYAFLNREAAENHFIEFEAEISELHKTQSYYILQCQINTEERVL